MGVIISTPHLIRKLSYSGEWLSIILPDISCHTFTCNGIHKVSDTFLRLDGTDHI